MFHNVNVFADRSLHETQVASHWSREKGKWAHMHVRMHVHMQMGRQVYLYISITHWTSAEPEITN